VTDPFVQHRGLLFTIAYELLGSSFDAEDVLQESWLRWSQVEQDDVRDPRAYLVRVVTRQSLNRLRSRRNQRESYVGEWLPEPLLTAPDVAEGVELAESVSYAMLVVLETLGPVERAVFVLREVFGYRHDEIAEIVDKEPAAVRQIAHRARAHVEARRPRMTVDATTHHEAAQRFFRAAVTGDLQGLLDVLAPDVVLHSDGGGRAKAALRPVLGADNVSRLLVALAKPFAGRAAMALALVNDGPGALLMVDGAIDTVCTVSTDRGRVTDVYLVRNPDKLTRLEPAGLSGVVPIPVPTEPVTADGSARQNRPS
jgi:RNA polymerase sigma-70 factor (TIGR02957 family)